ncbi:CRISPR-associated protein Cas10/Csm1, subtype III-A/MTUBE [Leptolyngbya sp. PCC 7375]|nr:CRISPR-associated protein Cas10/Csm1, subtype III-A/MTUBE [Leptolyngbya sp. PCC 7375]
MTQLSSQIALNIIQQALQVLANWVGITSLTPAADGNSDAIKQAKTWLGWPDTALEPKALQLVFDQIRLKYGTSKEHFWPVVSIKDADPEIPYTKHQTNSAEQLTTLKSELVEQLTQLSENEEHWNNLALLSLILEKYGSYISYGKQDIALYDLAKMTAAIASALAENPKAEKLFLIAGDLSGIQKFIYTIASAGALKSLRARSFLLELVAEEIVQQLLERLQLPRTSVIYSGGGNFYILAPSLETTGTIVKQLKEQFNKWLLDEFQGKVFLGLVSHNFPASEVATAKFANHWEAAIKELAIQKNRKFEGLLNRVTASQAAHEPCKVCHRDDTENLKPLGGDGPDACPTCRDMLRLGRNLYNVGAIVRTEDIQIPNAQPVDKVDIKIGETTIYYHFFKGRQPLLDDPRDIYLINNWDVSCYKKDYYRNPTLLLLGNYGQESAEEKGYFITAAEMADLSAGIKRVGHLRMDVDRLGQIFANGLGEKYNLPRLSGLSRQMSYFFKVYLNSLAETRAANLPKDNYSQLTSSSRDNLLFIYAGGDDLFISGAWNDTVEFAFDVYQSFRAYTGYHPDITLSGGISLSGPKYPLYQSADDSGKAEDAAKKNGRDSLALFDETFKWEEWLGKTNTNVSKISTITEQLREYLGSDIQLELYGILPFVSALHQSFRTNIPRSFARNLLTTAQIQEQQVKAVKDTKPAQAKDIQYFLHLPKVAYTLARLPNSIRAAPDFDAVSTSLKSPYNAPYFRAIATWLDLLNRSTTTTTDKNGQE